jgi:hypothetical protein
MVIPSCGGAIATDTFSRTTGHTGGSLALTEAAQVVRNDRVGVLAQLAGPSRDARGSEGVDEDGVPVHVAARPLLRQVVTVRPAREG